MHAFNFATVLLGGLVALVAAAPRAVTDCWSQSVFPHNMLRSFLSLPGNTHSPCSSDLFSVGFEFDNENRADLLKSESAPNPLSALYPQSLTGTLNGTIYAVPVLYSVVDDVIGGRWPVLRKAIHELFPYLPADRYPVSYSLSSTFMC